MKKIIHQFTETGEKWEEIYMPLNKWLAQVMESNGAVGKLLTYERIIEEWKPEMHELYFFISTFGEIQSVYWQGNPTDNSTYDYGNCFPTKELAEEKLKQIKDILKGVTQ